MSNINSKEHFFAIVRNPKTGQLENREIKRRSEDYKLHDNWKKNIEQSIRQKKRLDERA